MRGGLKKYVDFQNSGTKKLSFKIGGPKVQKYQNRGTKSAFKPTIFNFFYKIIVFLKFLVGRLRMTHEKHRPRSAQKGPVVFLCAF
jgi:hypothetical protein